MCVHFGFFISSLNLFNGILVSKHQFVSFLNARITDQPWPVWLGG